MFNVYSYESSLLNILQNLHEGLETSTVRKTKTIRLGRARDGKAKLNRLDDESIPALEGHPERYLGAERKLWRSTSPDGYEFDPLSNPVKKVPHRGGPGLLGGPGIKGALEMPGRRLSVSLSGLVISVRPPPRGPTRETRI